MDDLENRDKQKEEKQNYPQSKHAGAGGGGNAHTINMLVYFFPILPGFLKVCERLCKCAHIDFY